MQNHANGVKGPLAPSDSQLSQVGNPAMWSMPPSSPPISIGESAFNAVEIDDLAVAEAGNVT